MMQRQTRVYVVTVHYHAAGVELFAAAALYCAAPSTPGASGTHFSKYSATPGIVIIQSINPLE
jgi:hypothetical protein